MTCSKPTSQLFNVVCMLNQVEDVGFRRLTAKDEPHYKLPSPQYFSMSLIPDMYEAVPGKVRQLISTVKCLGFTTDA